MDKKNKKITIYNKSGNSLVIEKKHKELYIGKGWFLSNPIKKETKQKDS